MNYETVFDINEKPFSWGFAVIFVALLVVGSFLLWKRFKFHQWMLKSQWMVLGLGLLLVGVIGTLVSSGLFWQLWRNKMALNQGQALVVEGRITNFRPMPPRRHAEESFEVNGKQFKYSDWAVTPGFNQTVLSGGSLHNGQMVRISYLDGYILKLEIQRE